MEVVSFGHPTLEEIRTHNPDLDEEQAQRGFLAPLNYETAELDALVTSICASRGSKKAKDALALAPRIDRVSRKKLIRQHLQPYTFISSLSQISRAAYAGFFIFGSEFNFPDLPLEDRSFLNYELGTHRIVLRHGHALKIGKKTLDMIGATAASDWAVARTTVGIEGTKDGRSKTKTPKLRHSYVLTVNRDFEQTLRRIIDQHGTDWCGFTPIRESLMRLYTMTSKNYNSARTDIYPGFKMISIELWDSSSAKMVSGEIGYIVGSCYTCLSLFHDEDSHRRCSRIRAKAAILWLRRSGVQLVDVGTTANYYQDLHGFERVTATTFVDVWRRFRHTMLTRPDILTMECLDVHGLLQSAISTPKKSAKAKRHKQAQEITSAEKSSHSQVWITYDSTQNLSTHALLEFFSKFGNVKKIVPLKHKTRTENEATETRKAIVIFEDSRSASALELQEFVNLKSSQITISSQIRASKKRRISDVNVYDISEVKS